MFLNSLYLRNFRNYEEQSFVFGPKMNLIEGINAQGKTNLLEAVYLLSFGRSFRTPHLTDLIRHGQIFFFIEGQFIRDGITQVLKLFFDGKNRKMHYNQSDYNGFSNLLGLLPSVLYSPEDVSILTGSPSDRRRFIDLHIAQFDPLYVHHLTRYFKAVKQRNYLLRQKNEQSMDAWETSMAFSAAYIIQKRIESVSLLSKPISETMQELSDGADDLQIIYDTCIDVAKIEGNWAEFLQRLLKENRKRDMHVGSTLLGPHRDDLQILVNGKSAKIFSSEGQKRCCSAAIRLAQWGNLRAASGCAPLMCVDDFGVHLDTKRSVFLQKKVRLLGQVFLTSPSFEQTEPSSAELHMLKIYNGALCQS